MNERIEIANNKEEKIILIPGTMGFALVHESYVQERTWVMTLNPREARTLRDNIDARLPEIEKRCHC
jgi:hypothetical protein